MTVSLVFRAPIRQSTCCQSVEKCKRSGHTGFNAWMLSEAFRSGMLSCFGKSKIRIAGAAMGLKSVAEARAEGTRSRFTHALGFCTACLADRSTARRRVKPREYRGTSEKPN